MCDRNHGAALREPLERELNLLLGFGVERGGGFVEEENGRVLEQGPGDGEALLLSAGKETALIADQGLVALWLRHDEVVRISRLRRGLDFFLRRIEPAKLDVFQNCVVKRKVSCETSPMCLRSERCVRVRKSCPSIRTTPFVGS